MAKILGFGQSVHSLECTDRKLAEAIPAFWEAQPVPPAEQEGQVLVSTADGKGVPMGSRGQCSLISIRLRTIRHRGGDGAVRHIRFLEP
jgi:hypothetical protein